MWGSREMKVSLQSKHPQQLALFLTRERCVKKTEALEESRQSVGNRGSVPAFVGKP
jgi:hypothetical protein